MESLKPLCVWLQQWKLSANASEAIDTWRLLPKGTEVYFFSHRWLEQLWDAVSAAPDLQSVPSLHSLRSLPLRNTDIRSSYTYSQLSDDALPGQHFAVVSASVYYHAFAPLVHDSEEVMYGFVVWDGIFTPKVVSAPYMLPCIVEIEGEHTTTYLRIEGIVSVQTAVQKLMAGVESYEDLEIKLWTSDHGMSLSSLSETLYKHQDMGGYEWLREIGRDWFSLLAALNSQVLFIEVRPKRLKLSRVFEWFTEKPSVGLKNVGKSCYMNSVLQCLVHTYEFSMLFAKRESPTINGKLLSALKELIFTVILKRAKTFDPEKIYVAIYGADHNRDQEDAHALLLDLFSQLQQGFSEPADIELQLFPADREFELERAWLYLSSQFPVMYSSIYGGVSRNSLICTFCGNATTRGRQFSTLPLHLSLTRKFKITLIYGDCKRAPTQFTIKTSTPIESIETVHNIWQKIAVEQQISNFVIGQLRNNLFVPSGLSNIAGSGSYIVLELPPPRPDESLIMVDVYTHDEDRQPQPVATRLFSVPNSAKIAGVSMFVLSTLVDTYGAYIDRQNVVTSPSTLLSANREKMYNQLTMSSTLYVSSLSWSSPSAEELDASRLRLARDTVAYLCQQSENTIPRLALKVANLPKGIADAMHENFEKRRIQLGDLFNYGSDKTLTITFLQMLEYSLADKPLNEEDVVFCAACGRSCQHIASFSITHFPRVAVFALQRAHLEDSRLRKTEVFIQYPTKGLDLSQFEQAAATDPPIYDLIGVVMHNGGLMRGHYQAMARHPASGKWFLYNDTSTKEINEDAVVNDRDAYLLFYARRYRRAKSGETDY